MFIVLAILTAIMIVVVFLIDDAQHGEE